MKRLLLFIPLILFAAMVVLFNWGVEQDPDSRTALEAARLNQPVPAFKLTRLEDQSPVDQTALRGQPMLLNVWATWCPSCSVEHPYFMKLAQSGVPIVGLNYKDDRAAALKWLKDLGDPYSLNLFDPEGRLGFDLGVYGAPETYVLDSSGVIRYRHVGVVDEKVWNEILAPIMREYGYGKAEAAPVSAPEKEV